MLQRRLFLLDIVIDNFFCALEVKDAEVAACSPWCEREGLLNLQSQGHLHLQGKRRGHCRLSKLWRKRCRLHQDRQKGFMDIIPVLLHGSLMALVLLKWGQILEYFTSAKQQTKWAASISQLGFQLNGSLRRRVFGEESNKQCLPVKMDASNPSLADRKYESLQMQYSLLHQNMRRMPSGVLGLEGKPDVSQQLQKWALELMEKIETLAQRLAVGPKPVWRSRIPSHCWRVILICPSACAVQGSECAVVGFVFCF